MARPQKEGMDYFPLDVDMDQDDKIRLIEAKHGIHGFALIIKLLMKIYKEGYYYHWTEREQLLFSDRVKVDISLVNEIVNEALKWGLFNQDIYDSHQVLTSSGIQKRYIEAAKRRKELTLINEYVVIDVTSLANKYKIIINLVSVNQNLVNVDNNHVNVDINPERKEKERKVKESKEEESKEDARAQENESPPSPHSNRKINVPVSFEKEFGRPLSPVEFERIKAWEDEHSELVILEALKRAVLQGKWNFKYIDSILLEWKKNNVRTLQEVIEYEKRFKTRDKPKNVGGGSKNASVNRGSNKDGPDEDYRNFFVNLDD